jgi:peptidoglycan-associated lipoprotein
MVAHRRLGSLSFLAGAAMLACACGGDKPPPVAPASAPPAPVVQSPQTNPSSTPNPPSTIAISDEIRTKCGIPDADAYFPFDSAHVTANDRTPLDQVVKCFTAGPLKGRVVKLVGRADPRGESDYNMTLGQSRADAVGSYLSGRGMDKSKAQSTSRGAMDASGTDERGWQRDRRVDVMLGN